MPYSRSLCSVPFCKNKRTDIVSLHTFPNNIDLRQKWINAIFDTLDSNSIFTITEFSLICSEHFTLSCFRHDIRGKRMLTKDAIPTKFRALTHLEKDIYQCKNKSASWTDIVTTHKLSIHNKQDRSVEKVSVINCEALKSSPRTISRIRQERARELKNIKKEKVNTAEESDIKELRLDSLSPHDSSEKDPLEPEEQCGQNCLKIEEIYIRSDPDNYLPEYVLLEGTAENETKKKKPIVESTTTSECKNKSKSDLKHKNAPIPKLYKCEDCDYQTTRKAYLKRHGAVHKKPSELGIYKCGMCQFQTKYRRSLAFHKLTHGDLT